MTTWQLAISQRGHGCHGGLLHLFEESERTDILVKSACGKMFNPGFAVKRKFVSHCGKCKKK